MDEPTLYELLGVGQSATSEEIRAAHRRLLRTAHPDAGGTAGLFRAVQHAYETLSDPARRAAYDAELRTGGPAPRRGEQTGASARTGASGPDGPAANGSARGARAGEGPTGRRPSGGAASGGSPYPPGSGRSSLYRPMERPPRMPVAELGAIFDPPLFSGEESAGRRRRRGIGPIGAPWNRGGERREVRAATDLLPMALLRQRTIGVPGAGYEELSRAAELEREAARRTAEVLETAVMPGYPAMRLVHDLRDPGTRTSIIDHAVVIGDRVVLLDSVMVTDARATWDGTTLRSGDTTFAPDAARILEQARLWLDPWRVDLVVVVHAASGKLAEPVVTAGVRDAQPDAVRAVVRNPLQLIDLMRELAVLEARTHVVNVRLVRAVLKLRPGLLD